MPRKESHAFAWSITGLVFLIVLAVFRAETREPAAPRAAAPAAGRGAASWFLVLRMPEISAQHESGVDTMKIRVDQWMAALLRSGFTPMRLSDALARVERHEGLPERTVVLFFSPGYRRTYEILSPILLSRGIAAVWLTRKEPLDAGDRRYLTYHALAGLRDAGWDSGFAESSGSFRLEGEGKARTGSWSATGGALALNRDGSARALEFLTVNSDWTDQELIDRLRAEALPSGEAILGKAVIHSREWGVARPSASGEGAAFALRASPTKRGQKLFWLCTAGQSDFRLRAEVRSLVGELWLQMRYDEASGDDVHLILSGRSLVVEERRKNRFKRLQVIPQAQSFQGRPFALDARLSGRRLTLTVDHQEPRIIDGLAPPAGDKGLLQLYLADRVRGAAKADSVRLSFTPLADGPR